MKKAYIFDLDRTVVDSDHRVKPCMKENGDLDLDKYIKEACTEEKVMKDTLLPLANYMKQLIEAGEKVIILTARWCLAHDYVYLRKNGLRPCLHLSRDQLERVFGEDAERIRVLGDAAYKKVWLEHLFQTLPEYDFCFFDDHDGVLEMAEKLGVKSVDAKIMNQLLQDQFVEMYMQGVEDTESMYEALIEECSEKDLVIFPEWFAQLILE